MIKVKLVKDEFGNWMISGYRTDYYSMFCYKKSSNIDSIFEIQGTIYFKSRDELTVLKQAIHLCNEFGLELDV